MPAALPCHSATSAVPCCCTHCLGRVCLGLGWHTSKLKVGHPCHFTGFWQIPNGICRITHLPVLRTQQLLPTKTICPPGLSKSGDLVLCFAVCVCLYTACMPAVCPAICPPLPQIIRAHAPKPSLPGATIPCTLLHPLSTCSHSLVT